MKIYKYFSKFSLAILSLIVVSCDYYGETQPTDIITGKMDLNELYAKEHMDNPVRLAGKVFKGTTTTLIEGVKIVARLDGSETKYFTTSKEDGSFSLYVEGFNDYIIYGQKDGFEKSYYKSSNGYYNDSVTSVSYSNDGYNINLFARDTTPTFKISYQNSYVLEDTYDDIAYSGTSLIAGEYSYFQHYSSDAQYLKSVYSTKSFDFFTAQDTILIGGTQSSKTLSKIGQKSGTFISSFTVQIPETSLVDVEVYNKNIWLASSTQLFQVSAAGLLISKTNLIDQIIDVNIKGIANNGSALFILNKEKDASTSKYRYILYKIDPSNGKVLSKGFLPDNLRDSDLKSLTFGNKSFWTINKNKIYYYEDNVVKFTITE